MIVQRCTSRVSQAIAIFGSFFVASCFSVNEETVKTMSSGRLCDLLTPKYITLPSENRAARAELRRRNVRCGRGYAARESRTPPRRQAPPRRGPSSGSGVVVNASGDVLTNQHVIAKCESLFIELAGTEYPGVLRTQDSAKDLAIVRAAGLPIKGVARFRVERMRLGSNIVVLGYPLTTILGTDLKATTGNISGLSGLRNNTAFFQLTAPIQPGNGGGPVVGRTGAVVGIVSSKLKEIAVARKIGTLTQLINFGVKSRTVRSFMESSRIAFTVSRKTRQSNTVDIVSSARKYTVRVLCK